MKSAVTRRVIAAVVVVLIVVYLAVLISYAIAGRSAPLNFAPGTANGANYVGVQTSVLTIDPARKSMAVRLTFDPHGTYAAAAGEPATNLLLRINNSSGADDYRFNSGEKMMAVDATLDMDGDVANYPFDGYNVPLEVELSEAAAAGSAPSKPVPVRLTGASGLHSYNLTSSLDPSSTDGDVTVDVSVHRSARTVAFAVMIIAAMIASTGVLLAMAIYITIQQRRVEYPMFAFMAGTLFAITAVRNAMPDTPPAGTLSDYLVFFWSLGIVAASLVLGIIGWIRRPIPYS